MALNAPGLSGIPRYTSALSRAIDSVVDEFPGLDITLVTTRAFADVLGAQRIGVRPIAGTRRSLAGPIRLLAEQLSPPLIRSDIVHFFDVNASLLAPSRPFVTTFHDASVRRTVGSTFAPLRRAYKLRLYPWSLPRATAIVAVSQFAKEELISHFGIDPTRVTVIHSGPGLVDVAPDVRSDYGGHRVFHPSRPYLLFVGSLTASKNVPFLVRAYDRANVGADLVLAGRPLDALRAVEDAVRSTRRPERIHIVPQPDDAEVGRLYAGALAFLFPSLYEGFGFPPLEAMARNCPVVASDIPPLREVSGAGALLLPLEESVWADAIQRVVLDETLRASLRSRGERMVKTYSWDETARRLCRLLESIGSAQGRESSSMHG